MVSHKLLMTKSMFDTAQSAARSTNSMLVRRIAAELADIEESRAINDDNAVILLSVNRLLIYASEYADRLSHVR